MKKDQNGFGVVEILIVLAALALLGGASYYFVSRRSDTHSAANIKKQSSGPYITGDTNASQQTRLSVTNDGASFSFDLGLSAQTVKTSNSEDALEYYKVNVNDTAINAFTFIPKNSTTGKDLSCETDNNFKVNILGSPHEACSKDKISYIANFNSGQKWYQVGVYPKDRKTTISQETVTKLFESLKAEH